MIPANTLGNKSTDCPEVVCYDTCAPCEHKQFVYDNSTEFVGNPKTLLSVIDAVLDVHEKYLQQLCELELDVCKRGELANFPCNQCGLIDPATCLVLGEPIYNLQSCNDCMCYTPLDFSGCTQRNVDLSKAPYTAIYSQMIEAIDELSSGYANGGTVESFLQKFLPGSSLLFVRDGIYHISIGTVTNDILSILPLLERLAPLPIGAGLRYYTACP